MKIRYEFVTGEVAEIEIDDALGAEVAAIERTEARRDHTETRRHTSYDYLLALGAQISDGSDLQADFEAREEVRALRKALAALEPQQRELIKRMFIDGERLKDIAERDGIALSSAWGRFNRIYERLKKNLSEGG